jgi:hypothetical protein
MDDATAPSLHLRRTAVVAGWSDDELARMVRSGELARVRRGAYVAGGRPTDRAVAHALLVRATVAGLRRPAAVSHQSAAVLHGLPLWNTPLDRVHVTRRPGAWHDSGRVLHVHVARLGDEETTLVDGILVTDAVRTALDLARSLPREAAVVALDAALHRELVSSDVLESRLPDIVGTPGSRGAARAVAFADARSESVGESRSRVLLDREGLAPSTLQHPVHRADGSRIGRTDFAWEDQRLVGEFDGRVKYGRLLRPGQTAGDAVFEEKRREDRIRDEGWRVLRWVWGELAVPHRFAGRVRRSLERLP